MIKLAWHVRSVPTVEHTNGTNSINEGKIKKKGVVREELCRAHDIAPLSDGVDPLLRATWSYKTRVNSTREDSLSHDGACAERRISNNRNSNFGGSKFLKLL